MKEQSLHSWFLCLIVFSAFFPSYSSFFLLFSPLLYLYLPLSLSLSPLPLLLSISIITPLPSLFPYNAFFSIRKLPTVLEFYSYVFFFPTCLHQGPHIFFSEFRAFMDGEAGILQERRDEDTERRG